MYRIMKEFHFSASHQLSHLPKGHQCARLHGHNYVVVVELASASLNADGFVRDYAELKALKRYIDEAFDHRHLNEVMEVASTAERRRPGRNTGHEQVADCRDFRADDSGRGRIDRSADGVCALGRLRLSLLVV
jgi:6-pyruvoyltetrahydropterin/6-carboxytetrahydropterin synthase